MKGVVWEELRTLRRVWNSPGGRAELCRDEGDRQWIRLVFRSSLWQRQALACPGDLPMRMEGTELAVLLPGCTGLSLEDWLERYEPALEERREKALALVEQVLVDDMPPWAVALSARAENLCITGTGAALQYLGRPDLQADPSLAGAVCGVACLCREMVTKGLPRSLGWRNPPGLELLCRRAEEGYQTWEQLYEDLKALPTQLTPPQPPRAWLKKCLAWLTPWAGPALRVAAAVLAVAAVLSLVMAWRAWVQTGERAWPGMTPLGTEQLG